MKYHNIRILITFIPFLLISCASQEESTSNYQEDFNTFSMIDDPDKDANSLEVSPKEFEQDFFEIITIAGYVGSDIKLESSYDLVKGRYGKASIRSGQRIIKYTLSEVLDANNALIDPSKRWCSKWILAHELGHHLHNHVDNDRFTRRAKELQADRYAGYIMRYLNASIEETNFLIENYYFNDFDDYPDRYERLEFITDGWNKADELIKLKSSPNNLQQ